MAVAEPTRGRDNVCPQEAHLIRGFESTCCNSCHTDDLGWERRRAIGFCLPHTVGVCKLFKPQVIRSLARRGLRLRV